MMKQPMLGTLAAVALLLAAWAGASEREHVDAATTRARVVVSSAPSVGPGSLIYGSVASTAGLPNVTPEDGAEPNASTSSTPACSDRTGGD